SCERRERDLVPVLIREREIGCLVADLQGRGAIHGGRFHPDGLQRLDAHCGVGTSSAPAVSSASLFDSSPGRFRVSGSLTSFWTSLGMKSSRCLSPSDSLIRERATTMRCTWFVPS